MQPSAENGSDSNNSDAGGAYSGALAPDLAEVVSHWPKLDAAVQVGILAIVRASVKGEQQ
jgi:hypothetical protein